MADNNKTAIGSRDDVNIDVSRCLRMRFSESRCLHCVNICPHGAVVIDDKLSIDPEKCLGCLLCTAVCPTGALEHKSDFSACLKQLAGGPQPILGCIRTQECSNATVSCLTGLSPEHLLTLCHTLQDQLTLNMTACGDCPNSATIPHLHQRLTYLSETGLSDSTCRIIVAESAQEFRYNAEAIGRRSFFKSFRNSLFQSAVTILSGTDEQAGKRTGYGEKRVPIRRELLNRTRDKLSQEQEIRLRKHFDSYVSFDENCTRCYGCVAICPTGALQSELSEMPPAFERLLCTGCGLCREFCLDGAVRISTGDCDEAGV